MPSRITMSGFVSAECEARTVGDLRALVKWCDEYAVDDKCGLDWGMGKLYVELTGDRAVPAEWIECGDHMGDIRVYDVIVPTHEHPEYEKDNGPDNYEEAREMAESKPYKTETLRMYQDRINRYADERRPE